MTCNFTSSVISERDVGYCGTQFTIEKIVASISGALDRQASTSPTELPELGRDFFFFKFGIRIFFYFFFYFFLLLFGALLG